MDRIAFLGAGNMAAAMVDGLLAKGAFAPAHVSCMGGGGKTAQALSARTGIRLAHTLDELFEGAGTVVLAFKPQHLASADTRLGPLCAGRLVISILAGKRMATLVEAFPRARNVVRSMPNTPGRIGAGVTGWCSRAPLSAADARTLGAVFGALGRSVELPETQLDAFTALCGSGPGYIFEFAAALRDAGVAAGLERSAAAGLVADTLLGAARLLAARPSDPEALRNEVTSPNGVTAAGLKRLSERDLRGIVRDCVLAARARAQELSA